MDLKLGSKKVIKQLGLSNEKCLVLYDNSTKEIAESFNKVYSSDLKEITRPIPSFSVDKYKAIILMISKQPGEDSFRNNLKRECFAKEIKFVNMPGITKEAFLSGMKADYDEVKIISKKIYDKIKDSKIIKIKAINTDLTIEQGDNKWINADGDYREFPQKGSNFPSGEVYTWPKNVNGKLNIDGILGSYLTRLGTLEKNPLKLEIKNSKIIKIECENETVLKEFKRYTETDENSSIINELGIGTNIGIKKLIGIMVHDEKFPSVHLAVGSSCPGTCNERKISESHCDMIVLNPTIFADDEIIMKDGNFI